jgi:DNA repair exonuclease SbcCD ATPase subunit
MATFTEISTYVIETCCECGVHFGVPQHLQSKLVEKHKTFYCPNGHGQAYYGESRETKLKRQLEQTTRQLADTQGQLQLTERRRRAAKGQLTKTKRRIANGVCPCCQRHFENLGSHMHTQHPDYVDEVAS